MPTKILSGIISKGTRVWPIDEKMNTSNAVILTRPFIIKEFHNVGTRQNIEDMLSSENYFQYGTVWFPKLIQGYIGFKVRWPDVVVSEYKHVF